MMAKRRKIVRKLRPYPWYEAWFHALTRPSSETFASILTKSQVDLWSAYRWVITAALVSFLFGWFISLFDRGIFHPYVSAADALAWSATNGGTAPGTWVLVLLFGVLIAGLGGAAGLTLTAGLNYFWSRRLGSQSAAVGLVHGLAAYMAPLSIVTGILFSIPVAGSINASTAASATAGAPSTPPLLFYIVIVLVVLAGAYSIYLNVVAVMACCQVGRGKAIAIVAASDVLVLLLAAGAVILLSSSTSSGYLQHLLATPTPGQ